MGMPDLAHHSHKVFPFCIPMHRAPMGYPAATAAVTAPFSERRTNIAIAVILNYWLLTWMKL